MDIQSKRGFTIVELMIVIVVIAILAAISIVAYIGIQSRAHDTAIREDVRQVGIAMQILPPDEDLPTSAENFVQATDYNPTRGSYDLTTNNGWNPLYCRNSDTGQWAFIARSLSGNAFYYSSETGVVTEFENPEERFPAVNATVCGNIGIDTSGSNAGGAWLHGNTSNGWRGGL